MGYLLTTKFFKKHANYCGDKSHAFVNSMIKVLENIIIMFCSNLSSNLIVYACFFYHKYVIFLKVSAGASVHTSVSTVHKLNQHRLQTQPCQKADYVEPANVHV